MGEALNRYVDFWRNAYERGNLWRSVIEKDGEWPGGLQERLGLQAELPPEPYYGYFHEPEQMKEDVLLLLYNPKEVNEAPSRLERWHSFNRERYLQWNTSKYREECGYNDRRDERNWNKPCTCLLSELRESQGEGCQWRRRMFGQVRKNLVPDSRFFLHTMEYSFFHSDKWNDLKDYHDWIASLPTTQMALDALIDIASEGIVKHIIGFGKAWESILSREPRLRKLPTQRLLSANGSQAHRFTVFTMGAGTPILIYLPSGKGMNLPNDPKAIQTMLFLISGESPGLGVSLSVDERSDDASNTRRHNNPLTQENELLDRIVRRVQESLPSDRYDYLGPSQGSRFVYLHFVRKDHSLWDIQSCNMRLRVYRKSTGLFRTRVEFGIDTVDAILSKEKMDQLKKALDDYAALNSLERKKKRFDTMYWEDTDDADIIVKVTAQRMVEMTKYMELVLDKI